MALAVAKPPMSVESKPALVPAADAPKRTLNASAYGLRSANNDPSCLRFMHVTSRYWIGAAFAWHRWILIIEAVIPVRTGVTRSVIDISRLQSDKSRQGTQGVISTNENGTRSECGQSSV